MADVFSKAKRSHVMSQIRGRGNKDTELALVRFFRRHGIKGWRRHVPISVNDSRANIKTGNPERTKTGSAVKSSKRRVFRVHPDFVFPGLRLVVFVDGCFWHSCPLHATQPKNNAAFWRTKLTANQARDRLVTRKLRSSGWRVLRLWEHELDGKDQVKLLRRLERALASSKKS